MFELSFLKTIYKKYLAPLLAITLMALILAALLISFIVNKNMNSTRDDVKGHDYQSIMADKKFKHELFTRTASDKINAKVESVISDLQFLSSHPAIKNYDLRQLPKLINLVESDHPYLKEFKLISKSNVALYTHCQTKNYYEIEKGFLNKESLYAKSDWKEIYISSPVVDIISQAKYINIYTPVRNDQGEILGDIGIRYDLEFLKEKTIDIDPKEWGKMYVLNDKNETLVGVGLENINEEPYNRLSSQDKKRIKENRSGYYMDDKLFSFHKNSFGWTTVMETPEKVYMKPIVERMSQLQNQFGESKKGTFLFMIGTILCIICFCVYIGTKVAEGVTRPINNLLDATTKVQEGDLDVVIEVESQDELGQLAQSFNTMTESVSDFQEKLIAEKGNVEEKTLELEKANSILENQKKLLEDQARELSIKNLDLEKNGSLLLKSNSQLSKQKDILIHQKSQLETHQLTLEQQKALLESQKQQLEEQTDVLHQQKMELAQHKQKLEIQAKKLLESNNALSHYARTVSHDLKEPLRMVNSYVNLLKQNYLNKELDQEGEQYMTYTLEGTKRMGRIIDDLLHFASFDVNVERQLFEEIDLNDALIGAKHNLRVLVEESKAKINCVELPKVKGKFTFMMQVFQNLLSNSMRYRKESESIVIDINAIQKEGFWMIEVKDNGEGIDSQHLENIFLAFKRFNNKYRSDGSGIGLAIVRKIIHHHGGRIWAKSKKGIGTNFYFTLPISQKKTNGVSLKHVNGNSVLNENK